MAVITLLTSTFNTTTGTHTATGTPAVGDLIIVICAHTGTVAGTTITDNNADGLGAYSFVTFATKNTTTDTMGMFVRNSRVGSATSTIFSVAPGTTTGGGLAVLKITGMNLAGGSAIQQSVGQSDQAAAGTPAPVLGSIPKSFNAVLAAMFNAANPATMTQRTGYTELLDTGYNTPTTGIEVMSLNSGETSATLTWGGASATAFGAIAAELIANSSPTTVLNSPADTALNQTLLPTLNFTGTDNDSDAVEYELQLFPGVKRDNYTGNQTSTSSTATYSHTVGATGTNRLLVVGIATRGGSISGVTYGGNVMTKQVELLANTDSNTQHGASWWYLKNPPTGANNVVITRTFNTNTQTVASQATSYVNVNQTTPFFNSQIQNKGLLSNPSSSITATTGSLVLDMISFPDNGSGVTPSATAGQTQLYVSGTTDATRGAFSEKAGSAASITTSWTIRSEVVLQGMLVINPITGIDKLSTTDAGFTAGHPFASGVAKNFVVQSAPAIVATNMTTAGNNADQTSYATTSITPIQNELYLATVYSIAASAPNIPTATGNGLTWTQVATQLDDDSLRRITTFRAMGSAPTAGAITFDFAGQTQTGAAWSVVQYANVDQSGTNGSGAIVQSVAAKTTGSATSLSITLAAFGSSANATVGVFGIPLNTAGQPAVGSGFTATGQVNQATPNLSIGSEFNAGNDTSVDMNAGVGSIPWSGIAIEIKPQNDQLLPQTVYYWRVRAIDPSGTNTYGAYTAYRTFTANFTKTHTTDVNNRKPTTKTHTTDTNKRKVTTKTHTTDVNKKKSGFTKVHTTDTFKRIRTTKTHTTDIFKRIRTTKSHTTDTNKKKSTLKTHTTDVNKKKAATRTHTTDINKKKSGLTKTHTTDTFKRRRLTKTHTTDVNKKKSGLTKTHTTDTFKKMRFTIAHTTSVNKKKAAAVVHSTDINKKKSALKTHTTDTNKRKALAKVHSTDVNKKKSHTVSHSTDTLKRKEFTKIHTTDVFTHPGVMTYSLTHSTDVFKRRRLTKIHTTDTFKKRSGSVSHTTSVNKKKATTRSHSTDILLRIQSELRHDTDVFTHRTLTKAHTTSVNKKKPTLKTHTTSVNKRKGTTRIHTTDVLKRNKFTKSHTTDTTTHRSGTPHHSTDVNKKKPTPIHHTTSVNKAKIVTYDTEFILVDGKPALQIFEDFYIKL